MRSSPLYPRTISLPHWDSGLSMALLPLGAALLFGTPAVLDAFVPTHSTAFQVLDEHNMVRANRRLRAPLLRAMVELSDAIRPYNPEEEVEDGLFMLGLPLYSEIAIRELVGNALVHRDYSANGEIRVAIEGRGSLHHYPTEGASKFRRMNCAIKGNSKRVFREAMPIDKPVIGKCQ